jgi:uncharacterized protein (DUF2062 family)/CTP:molybdopterin cytidylyltransferase MocA
MADREKNLTSCHAATPEVFRPVVVAPTYNNDATLETVLHRILALGLPVIVVDDGSMDTTSSILARYALNREEGMFQVATHPRNRGKAAALKTGFAQAARFGYTHAVTIDTDGQLEPEDIPRLLEAARESDQALVLGCRKEDIPGYPAKSLAGRRMSNTLIRLECGQQLKDCQCGLRVYPLREVMNIRCRAGRFGYETEIITRAVWAGLAVREVPVTCHYPLTGRVTHFRPWRDSIRHIGLHTRLLARAFWPWPHRKVVTGPSAGSSSWRGMAPWGSPRKLWRQLRAQSQDRFAVAGGVAAGVFIANLPAYGYQTILSLYVARRWHLNPIAAVVGSQASTPPVGQVLWAAAIWTGHLLLTGSSLRMEDFDVARHGLAFLTGRVLLEWTLGGIIIGLALAVLSFIAVRLALSKLAKKSGERS